MNKNITISRFYDKNMKYSGQALAIVLVVLVVAVIIAMAIISRVASDRVRVSDERSSAESIEIADSALDSFRNVPLQSIKAVAENPSVTLCSTDPGYNFLEDGCELADYNQFRQFMNQLESEVPGFDSDPYMNSISTSLSSQCSGEFEDNGIKVLFEKGTGEDLVEVQKDDVFSIITSGQAPNPAACNLNLNLDPMSGNRAGAIVTPIYAQVDSNGIITSFKDYAANDSRGYCLGDLACNSAWPEWGNWVTSTGVISIPASSSGFHLKELRVRAVGSALAVTSSFTPNGCMVSEEAVKISAIVSCGGTSRGKEFVITDQEWAPALFDYLLFNGNGELRSE